MADTWGSLTGDLRPRGFSDVKDGLHKVIKAGCIKYRKEDDGDIKTLSERLWDAAGEDPELLISAIDPAIRKRTGFALVFSILKNPTPPPNSQQEDAIPNKTAKETFRKAVAASKQEKGDTSRGESFIFLYRSIRHHPWFKGRPHWVKLFFIELCLDASFKDHPYTFKGVNLVLKRGQYIILERAVAEEYGQTQRMVHYWLDKLENEGMISREIIKIQVKNCVSACVSANVSACVSGRVSGGIVIGTLVTICKYDEYQAEAKSELSPNVSPNVSACVSANVSACVSQTEECNTEERDRQKNEGTGGAQIPPLKKITKAEIFDIWEREKGPLGAVYVREAQNVDTLLAHLNNLSGSPQEHWITVIHKARQCHRSHYGYMSPAFFSKDLEHINQVLRGMYDHQFERKNNGQPTKFARAGRGDAADFGRTDESEAERAIRLANVFKNRPMR